MNTYEIIWHSPGLYTSTARNQVVDDPRPTRVTAKEYNYSITENGGHFIGVVFLNEEDEPILTLFDIPLGIRRMNA